MRYECVIFRFFNITNLRLEDILLFMWIPSCCFVTVMIINFVLSDLVFVNVPK